MLSDTFLTKGRAMGERLGLSFTQLLFVMNHESGLSPQAHNPNGDASGLLQWMPATLAAYGLTPEEMRGKTAEEQLPYVERYLAPYREKRLDFMGRIHQALFLPATLDEGYGRSQVLARQGGTKWGGREASYYKENARAFDSLNKGYITTGDLEDADMRAAKDPARNSRLLSALARLRELFPGDYKMAAKVWILSALGGLGLAGGAWWYFFGRKGAR
jgi:hypothetical protein